MMYKEKDKHNLIMGELMNIFEQSVLKPVTDDEECRILPINRDIIIAAFSPENFPEVQIISIINAAKKRRNNV